MKDSRKTEIFFYKCDVPAREEEIPLYSKTMTTTVVERIFEKHKSVYAKWREDTPGLVTSTFNMDIANWKGHRFIKAEDDVSVL